MTMGSDLALRYAAPVPRYTSYPTAPHFSPRVAADDVAGWLSALPEAAALSLYLHIPFCQKLCWYCGCNTSVINRYDPVATYLPSLEREIAFVAGRVPRGHRVTHLHWGGGSPNILSAADITRIAGQIRDGFNLAPGAEFAVEIDPRFMEPGKIAALASAGVNRVSIGVQDFDPRVQAAINREQSYEMTRDVVALLRAAGIGSINIDLVYGLPHQTQASVARTIEDVLSLAPDRIAIFAYAHLPERIRHQRLIDDAVLPGAPERLAQAAVLQRIVTERGYKQIGLDHFARETDTLATAPVHRNFQGYTTDTADALIGLGATSISRFPQGYAQNASGVQDYVRRVADHGLGTARGIALSDDDLMRAYVIERLMCDFDFSGADVSARYGALAGAVSREAEAVVAEDQDGLVERTADGFRLTERGRPFVRSICARFDSYLATSAARHAAGV